MAASPTNDPLAALPKFEEAKNYLVSGQTLNLLVAAIRANMIIDIDGAEIERTANGLKIKIR